MTRRDSAGPGGAPGGGDIEETVERAGGDPDPTPPTADPQAAKAAAYFELLRKIQRRQKHCDPACPKRRALAAARARHHRGQGR